MQYLSKSLKRAIKQHLRIALQAGMGMDTGGIPTTDNIPETTKIFGCPTDNIPDNQFFKTINFIVK